MTARRHHLWWFLLLLAAVACAVTVVPVHGWREDQGTVVPHDTFPGDCSMCHVTGNWHELRKDFRYDHEKQAGYALRGAHQDAQCLRCHNDRGPVQRFMARGCVGCHPDPHQGQAGRECQSCHDESTWVPKELIAQHRRTRFPLVGAHAATACFRCHPGAVAANFQRADVQCLGCHTTDLTRATNPDHVALGFDTDCQRCHIPTRWKDAHFAHAMYPLTGRHASTQCDQCHPNGRYAGTPRDCIGCHQTQYGSTSNPSHTAAGFGQDCAQCHTTSGWQPARYDHSIFALTGRHATTGCSGCHGNQVFRGTPRDCYTCHQAQYNAVSNPNHVASAFPTTCDSCHSTSGWRPARFDHTTFALTGAHATASCARCHPNNRYTGTPRDCFSCHQAQYNAVANPNHVTMAFPTNCDSCHTTSAWRPAQFAHTNWPLTGAHTTTSCARCHPNSRYTGTPRDCYSCHQARYNATTTPNHQQVSYPTTCESCHTTTAWQPANFNHTFPIRTGNHAVACTVCHNQPTNFPLYTCLVCHEHSQSSMNSHHSQVSGYSYVSTECVRCHPNGRH